MRTLVLLMAALFLAAGLASAPAQALSIFPRSAREGGHTRMIRPASS